MDKKSIVYVILGLIIVFLAAFLIISHVSTTDFEQQTFTNFVMDVPKGTEFVETYDNYSTIYTSEDLEVKYFRVTNNDEAFHIAGDHCGPRCAFHARGRRAEVAEDQHIVKDQVHQHRGNACRHGYHGLSGLPERAAVGGAEGKGNQTEQHNL